MRARQHTVAFSIALCCGSLSSSASLAHIDLLSPQPRASGRPGSNLDTGPCGQRSPVRVADKVSAFRPGETITVTWDAYVQHPSYFRLAFDLEGDDSFSERSSAPADPARDDPTELLPGEEELILDYVVDHAGELEHVEHPITLPREACVNCTLQLTQFIYDVPLRDAVYYQCVDMVLEGDPVEPAPVEGSMAFGAAAASPNAESPASQQNGCTLGTAPASQGTRCSALTILALFLARAAVTRWARRRDLLLGPLGGRGSGTAAPAVKEKLHHPRWPPAANARVPGQTLVGRSSSDRRRDDPDARAWGATGSRAVCSCGAARGNVGAIRRVSSGGGAGASLARGLARTPRLSGPRRRDRIG